MRNRTEVRVNFRSDFDEESLAKFVSDMENIISKYTPKKTVIRININSRGGYVHCLMDMFELIDHMKKLGFKFITYNEGLAASCGSVLFAVGDRRVTHPTAKLLIHQISYGIQGEIETHKRQVEEAKELNDKLFTILSKSLRYPKRKMLAKCRGEDWILTAREASELGFTEIGIL